MSKKVIIVIVAVILIIAIIVGVSISLMSNKTQEVTPVQSRPSTPLIKAPSTTTGTPAAPPLAPQPVTLAQVGRLDPCANYKDTDKNVSDECINQIWSNNCPNTIIPKTNTGQWDYWKGLDKKSLINNEMKAWASTTNPDWQKQACYGSKKEDPCANYKDGDKNVSDECMKSLWSNAGCKPEQFPYGNTVKDWKERTLTQLKGDMDYWANGPDWTKDICHGRVPPPTAFIKYLRSNRNYLHY